MEGNVIDADAIDLSKENIQPLRHGRKAKLLGLALQAQTDDDVQQKLLKERDEYEMLIRLYDGPDPLKPRYDYVLWLEQSYPKHGRESNLIPLLEDTITMYKEDDRYRQDPRFVELIIKFIDTQVNPLELYQVVYNLGIGTMCALLYKSWAEELDCGDDVKRADQIFKLGISNHAEPLESLRQEHKQFQLSVGRRLLCGEELSSKEEPINNQPPRQVLGKLRSKVGSSRPTLGKAGVVPLCLSNRNAPSKSNAPISIYQDDGDTDTGVNNVDNYHTHRLPKSDLAKKENSLKPGTWSKAYKPQKSHHSSTQHTHYTPTTPSFKIHEDNELSTPMTPMTVCPSALKTRKGEAFHCPVAAFEPPDPSVKPMYCKNKIYVGGREFQFEEIQAALYYKKMRAKIQEEEMEKLGIKINMTCLTTPQALRKEPYKEDNEPSTPFFKNRKQEPKTPFIYKDDEVDPITPFQSTSRFEFKTPYQQSNLQAGTPFQPFTPIDLPSEPLNEVVMEGAETTKKLDRTHQPPEPPKQDNTSSKLNNSKPTESTSNVKKFLNFAIFCDD